MIRRALLALRVVPGRGCRPTAATRIKDIVAVQGVRDNQLVGYGLVIGLNGTGDSLRNAPFTEQSLQSMLDRMGINVRNAKARTRNVAAVIVTAELPAFAGKGARIDVTVSSLGDATSLQGGIADHDAAERRRQPDLCGGAGPARGLRLRQHRQGRNGHPGRADHGPHPQRRAGRARRAGQACRRDGASCSSCAIPDFNTAISIADAINAYTQQRYGIKVAKENDLRTVAMTRPFFISPARFIAEVGELPVEPDAPARVVIDERTGTIVIGKDVQISTVAVAHGNLTVRVTENAEGVAAAAVLARRDGRDAGHADRGRRRRAPISRSSAAPICRRWLPASTGSGLKPPGIIAILQAIKSAGALQADLVVQ